MNALKFGFFARDTLLPGESDAEFADFRGRLHEGFHPEGGAEIMLVDRIAESGWRLRRFPAVEAAIYSAELLEEQDQLVGRQARSLLDHRLQPDASEAGDPEKWRELQQQRSQIRDELNSPRYALGRAFRRNGRSRSGFERLSRCEMLLERGFYRCLDRLLRLQEIRVAAENEKGQNEPTKSASLTRETCLLEHSPNFNQHG